MSADSRNKEEEGCEVLFQELLKREVQGSEIAKEQASKAMRQLKSQLPDLRAEIDPERTDQRPSGYWEPVGKPEKC